MSRPLVILSPHLDDAVLSCWRRLSGPGEVTVINVFAGVPPAGLTGWWDRLGGVEDSAARMHERLAEDGAAMERLGRRAVNLALLDRQYRARPAGLDELVEALRGALPEDAALWAPAAVGRRHPDHLAVRAAALALGLPVTLYADLPHASVDGWPSFVNGGRSGVDRQWETALADVGPTEALPRAAVHRLSPAEHASKVEVLRCYTSQLEALERDFGRALDDPDLLGYEVEWALSRSEAARRNPSASAASSTD
jgi:LmbE family N-acetylglucosaminyl deacetylase